MSVGKKWIQRALPIVIGAFLPSTGYSIQVREFEASRHNRFIGFPDDLTENPDFYQIGQDWSGFGWNVRDERQHFSLVSPKHFVGARHFRPRVGDNVRFVNRDGEVKTYTVAARHDILNDEIPALPSDLFVGELTEAVLPEDKISIVPVLNLPNELNYIGQDLIVSGRFSRAGEGSIAEIGNFIVEGLTNETRGFSFFFTDPGVGGDQCHLQGGDSGGPSAVLTPNGYALVGTHSALGETSSGNVTTFNNLDTFVPHFLSRLDAQMAVEGYHVQREILTTPNLQLTVLESGDPVFSSDELSYTFTVENLPAGEEAHNLQLDLTVTGATFEDATGTEWVSQNAGSSLQVLRGGLGEDGTTTITVTLALPTQPTGPVVLSGELSVDGGATLDVNETVEVIQSFNSWSANLTDAALGADPDGDGLSNEIEFLLGRDGGVAEGESALSFELGDNGVVVSFQERIFSQELNSQVVLFSSTDLENWFEVSNLTSSPLDYQLQEQSVTRSSDGPEFYRLGLSLGAIPGTS